MRADARGGQIHHTAAGPSSSQELMERAGAAIAEETEKLLRKIGGSRVLAVCGGGNNGGDGWCAARLLLEKGFCAAVYTLTDILSPDCAAQREKFTGEVYSAFPAEKFDVVIDAVFGTGFHGVPEGRFADAIARINASGAKVVSADIPSGLNGTREAIPSASMPPSRSRSASTK